MLQFSSTMFSKYQVDIEEVKYLKAHLWNIDLSFHKLNFKLEYFSVLRKLLLVSYIHCVVPLWCGYGFNCCLLN